MSQAGRDAPGDPQQRRQPPAVDLSALPTLGQERFRAGPTQEAEDALANKSRKPPMLFLLQTATELPAQSHWEIPTVQPPQLQQSRLL
jgi:hypothetical protein